MNSDKLFATFGKAILVLAVFVVVAVGAFYFGTKNGSNQSSNQSSIDPSVIPTKTLTPTPTVDETSNLKVIIKKALVAEHGSVANDLNVTVSKIEGEYAMGDASAQGGGGMWFAARQDGFWTLVWDGNGVIKCTDVSPFPSFPKDMIPECWDDKTQTIVKR